MNPEQERQLEREIDRLLKELPDLPAPAGLISRTMDAIARTPPARGWAAWPATWRTAYLALACGMLAAIFVGVLAVEPGIMAALRHPLARWAGGVECLWNALGALAGAAALVAEHLGNGFWLAALVMGLVAYAACVGLGTLFVRLALAKTRREYL
ncbi:MAG: hypothetical protein ABSG59_05760 [Verrucomicrobiota bacterium]